MFYYDKKNLWGNYKNTSGFEFYSGGIFEFYNPDNNVYDPTYNIVDYFNWMEKHDAHDPTSSYWDGDPDDDETGNGWMTSIKCQSGCWNDELQIIECIPSSSCPPLNWRTGLTCWAFSSVAAVESMTNIYFNDHLNLDLSEQEIISCTGIGNNASSTTTALNYIRDYGVRLEECYPYIADDGDCDDVCTNILDSASIEDYQGQIANNDIEKLKKDLIVFGPYIWKKFVPSTFVNHGMTLVGFGTITEGMYLYFDPILQHVYINEYYPNIGDTYWIFKNSGGTYDGIDGYFYMRLTEFPSGGLVGYDYEIIETPMYVYPTVDRLCRDEDNDDYYNWGIGTAPAGCTGEMDGNDNDPALGPMDENGFCKIIDTYHTSFEENFDGWKQSGGDDKDWLKHSGAADYLFGTQWGPENAYDDGGEYYLYVYGQTNSQLYEDAILESPIIEFDDLLCTYEFSFAFHKEAPYGGENSMLEVQVSTNGGETWCVAWGIYGNCSNYTEYDCNAWNLETIMLTSNVNKIRFYAKTGYSYATSSIAIDYVTINKIDNQNQLIITGNLEWNSDYHACNDIIIKPGAKLTIGANCTLFMPSGKKIIVERTGVLAIYGGTITGENEGWWPGVELWGENGTPNNLLHQGKVAITQGGTIKNAVIGIQTIKTIEGEYNYDYSGGIIGTTDANFINNQLAILFFPYEPDNSNSILKNCTFEVNDDFPEEISVNSLVSLNDINGVYFQNATFNDFRTYKPIDEKCTGIYSMDADFTVKAVCANPLQNPCLEWDNSTFNNLKYGIKALRSTSGEPFTVEHTDFVNNVRGIYASGADEISVTLSSFQTYKYDGELPENYGMYLEECTGYQIEENNFYNINESVMGNGLVVSNSGIATNQVYNNTFDKLEYGLIAQHDNRTEDGEDGLSIKCNSFTNCEYDIAVTGRGESPYLGIKWYQGSNDPEPDAPAGNRFSYTWNNEESDYYNETQDIIYWYHQHDGGYNVEPKKFSKELVNPQANYNNPQPFDPETACPSNLGGGGTDDLRGKMAAAEQKIDSVQNLLSILVDGGNTNVLTIEVQTSIPPETWDLYINLLGKSPYLSDTVMKSAINKVNVLPSELLTDVLVANPQSAKSDEVLTEVENRTIPLTDEMKEEIMLNWYVASAKESLESKLAAYKARRGKALNDLLRYFRNDTVSPSPRDSIIAVLQQENSLWAKYSLAYEHLAKGETIQAEVVMNNIPVEFTLSLSEQEDYQDHLMYFNILKQLKQEGKEWYEADTLQIEALYGLAYNNNNKANAYARNVLIFYDTLSYEEPIQYPSFLKSSPIIPIPAQKPAERNSLTIYPNPAKDYFIIRYELDNSYAEAVIHITDMTGRNVKEFNVMATRDYLIVPTSELNNGIYVVKLILNGKEAGIQKVSVKN
ncbi:MAG: T9SS type A sorting domain-containing protein [Bacteroidetes bacterium]|nr:T9SS type A sorting domain-containing protein [Bacteroidota bacterium]